MRYRKTIALISLVLIAVVGGAFFCMRRAPATFRPQRSNIRHRSRLPDIVALAEAEPVVATTRTPALDKMVLHAVLGVDSDLHGRTDAIHIVAIDSKSEHTAVIAVPRDLLVEVPGYGAVRINALLRVARRMNVDPLTLVRKQLETLIGSRIATVSVVTLEFFRAVVDAVGGVEVDVPCGLDDDFILRTKAGGRRRLSVDAGRQLMNGTVAAMYVRSRHGRSDWSRQRRLHAVMLGLHRRLRRSASISELILLWRAMRAHTLTNVGMTDLPQLVGLAASIEPAKLHGVVIGSKSVSMHRTADGKSVLLPNFAAIDAQLAGAFQSKSLGVSPHKRKCKPRDVALKHRAHDKK